ncbi:MAG: hypothetical protein IPI60_17540 [Saprospiraceae bacterium]|nr:hypothetical protein [Saprospiraceae bacterium]
MIRNADIAIPRLHIGFESRVSPKLSILAELGYGSSINGTVFSEYNARDISGNIGIRKYFGFKNSSRKYWILNLTQDYYKHDLRTWVCINDCEYFRRIHHIERTWRTGIMGGMGIVIKLGSRLAWTLISLLDYTTDIPQRQEFLLNWTQRSFAETIIFKKKEMKYCLIFCTESD